MRIEEKLRKSRLSLCTIADHFAKLEGEPSSLLAGESLVSRRETEWQLIALLHTIQRRFYEKEKTSRKRALFWLAYKKIKKKSQRCFPSCSKVQPVPPPLPPPPAHSVAGSNPEFSFDPLQRPLSPSPSIPLRRSLLEPVFKRRRRRRRRRRSW